MGTQQFIVDYHIIFAGVGKRSGRYSIAGDIGVQCGEGERLLYSGYNVCGMRWAGAWGKRGQRVRGE